MDTLQWKRRIAKVYPTPRKGIRKIVLIYHAVGSGLKALAPDLFLQQVQWLQQYCKILSLPELLNSTHTDPVQVAISFDDGYGCLYDVVAPMLSAAKVPATVYINTGWISEDEANRKPSRVDLGHYPDEKFLTWQEVNQLNEQNWEIASHGVNHFDLTQSADDVIQAELSLSKQDIETRLNQPCAHFAYTWGRHSESLQQAVAKAGYQYAVAAHHAVLSSKENNFALPRMNIEAGYSMKDFENIVLGKWDYLNIIQRMKKWI